MKQKTLVYVGVGLAALFLLNKKKASAYGLPSSGLYYAYTGSGSLIGTYPTAQAATDAAYNEGSIGAKATDSYGGTLWVAIGAPSSGGGSDIDWDPTHSPNTDSILSWFGF